MKNFNTVPKYVVEVYGSNDGTTFINSVAFTNKRKCERYIAGETSYGNTVVVYQRTYYRTPDETVPVPVDEV
jgi:hypothetical protein